MAWKSCSGEQEDLWQHRIPIGCGTEEIPAVYPRNGAEAWWCSMAEPEYVNSEIGY